MQLYRDFSCFWAWMVKAMRALIAVRPVTTIVVIGASGTARITSLLAFFLPLKVILLAGSSGVPSYFPFISPVVKTEWIAGLAAAAFICYALTLALDLLSQRLSERASNEVIQEANELMFIDDQDAVARKYYTTFCEISAHLGFVFVGIALLLIIAPWVASFLLLMFFSQFQLTSWIFRNDTVKPGILRGLIESRHGSYLKILVSFNFLGGFIVLLVPFLAGSGGNILIAFLSLLVMRQVLTSLSGVISNAVRLWNEKYRIDALIFREQQLKKPENQTSRTVREVFQKDNRGAVGRDILSAVGIDGEVAVEWHDSVIPGVKTLMLAVRDTSDGKQTYYLVRVYPRQSLRQLEQETFLFRHLCHHILSAPDLVSRHSEGDFECLTSKYGNGRTLTGKEWKDWKPKLIKSICQVQPPTSLVTAYTDSRPLLYQRLTDELVDRISIAIDTNSERKLFNDLQAAMQDIRGRLRDYPLYIYNPDLLSANIVHEHDGGVLATHWGRWSLEPLGSGRNYQSDMTTITDIIPMLRERRTDIPASYSGDDVRLSSKCQSLEIYANKEQYKAALRTMELILANPALHGAAAQRKRSLA